MASLCEECFKRREDEHFWLLMPGIAPCEQCGRWDMRQSGGLRVISYQGDPRKQREQKEKK